MGEMKKKLNAMKLNDRGAAMVTVVVVVLFVSILATTLLYISAMNFQIKQTDYRNQKSFYYGEISMEQLKAQFMEDASKAAMTAYEDTMVQFSYLGDGDARRWEYNQKFIDELKKSWDTQTSGDWENWIKSKAQFTLDTDGDGINDIKNIELSFSMPDLNVDGKLGTDEMLEVNADKGYVVVKGIEVKVTDKNDYTSIIYTDFYVEAPAMNWGVDKSETTAPADMDAALKKDTVEVSEFVRYVNWEKR